MNLKPVLTTEFDPTPSGNRVLDRQDMRDPWQLGARSAMSSALAFPDQIDRVVRQYMLRIW